MLKQNFENSKNDNMIPMTRHKLKTIANMFNEPVLNFILDSNISFFMTFGYMVFWKIDENIMNNYFEPLLK